jgi:hypothetical protein
MGPCTGKSLEDARVGARAVIGVLPCLRMSGAGVDVRWEGLMGLLIAV